MKKLIRLVKRLFAKKYKFIPIVIPPHPIPICIQLDDLEKRYFQEEAKE